MRIVSVRHGESENNNLGITQDAVKGSLSRKGLQQVRDLAKRLRDLNFDIIYCSDSQRTRETAEGIRKVHTPIPIIYTPQLRELDAGEFVGKPYELFEKAMFGAPEGFARFKPKRGESGLEFYDRINRFLEEIYQQNPQDSVLLVTHGGVNKSLKHLAENKGKEPVRHPSYRQDNACVNIFNYDGKDLELELYNDINHLESQ